MQFDDTFGRNLGYLWVGNLALLCSELYIFITVTDHTRSALVVNHDCKILLLQLINAHSHGVYVWSICTASSGTSSISWIYHFLVLATQVFFKRIPRLHPASVQDRPRPRLSQCACWVPLQLLSMHLDTRSTCRHWCQAPGQVPLAAQSKTTMRLHQVYNVQCFLNSTLGVMSDPDRKEVCTSFCLYTFNNTCLCNKVVRPWHMALPAQHGMALPALTLPTALT